MKKIEINRKKEKRLFKIIFLVPAILLIFLSIMIIASDNSSYESVFKTIFASFAIISIWFTISFVLTNIIALIFYKEKIIDIDNNVVKEEKINPEKNIDINIEKAFEYNLENSKFYKIYGEAIFFTRNKEKYLEFRRKKIGNYFNNILLLEICMITLYGVILRLIYKPFIMIFLYIFAFIAVILAYKKVIPQYGSRKNYI